MKSYKHLFRSTENKIFGGVIGGLAEYLNIDPTFLRVIWTFFLIVSGVVPALIIYIIWLIIVPVKGTHEDSK